MLLQGLNYYDYVSTPRSSPMPGYTRNTPSIRPPASSALPCCTLRFLRRWSADVKWLDLPISLFTFTCLKFASDDDVVPIFTEREITAPPADSVQVAHLDDHL